ncbi:MAG TPA: hypothetical protein VFU63_04750 [Ktedonobacterales bacterium]|nr:hypothetical protein [Ktedonobacterales bacterium]
MNNKVDTETRLRFRDWLREELRELDFYQRRGDHYLIREFAKYCTQQGAPIDEASLGRYLRDDDPVLPTPERCRALARVFGYAPVKVLIEAGYLEGDDLFPLLPKEPSASEIATGIEARKASMQQLEKAKNDEVFGPIVAQIEQSIKQLDTQQAGAKGQPTPIMAEVGTGTTESQKTRASGRKRAGESSKVGSR